MADDRAIVTTGQPDREVADRTIAVANPPAKEADVEGSAVPGKSGAEPRNKKRSKKVLCGWCCLSILGILLLHAIILIILIFTVFRVKDPTIIVTNITMASISISAPITLSPIITLNAVANTNVNVHNPNLAGLKYTNSTAYIFYRGEQVAQAPIPAGHIKAHGNEHLFLPVDLTLSTNNIANLTGNLTNDLFNTRTLPLVSRIDITGTVKVIFVQIKNVRASATCNINYFLANGTQTFDCQYKTKI